MGGISAGCSIFGDQAAGSVHNTPAWRSILGVHSWRDLYGQAASDYIHERLGRDCHVQDQCMGNRVTSTPF